MYAAGVECQGPGTLEDSYPPPPEPGPSPTQPRLNPVTDRAALSAVARSPERRPIEKPNGRSCGAAGLTTIRALLGHWERAGSGTGQLADLVFPNPGPEAAQMRQRHTARTRERHRGGINKAEKHF